MPTSRAVDRALANVLLALVGPGQPRARTTRGEYAANGADGLTNPNDVYVYIYAVVVAWLILAIASGLLMVLLGFIGYRVAGSTGRSLGLMVGFGLTFFCSAGAADAAWRSLVVYAVRRRFRRSGQINERDTVKLQMARPGSLRLPLQLLVSLGAVFAAAFYLY